MKAIFLSEEPSEIEKVYSPFNVQDLVFDFGLFPQFFKKSDVLSDPLYFEDVNYIFSVPGAVSFSEEEILMCFPRLKALFLSSCIDNALARPFLKRGVNVVCLCADGEQAKTGDRMVGVARNFRLGKDPDGAVSLKMTDGLA